MPYQPLHPDTSKAQEEAFLCALRKFSRAHGVSLDNATSWEPKAGFTYTGNSLLIDFSGAENGLITPEKAADTLFAALYENRLQPGQTQPQRPHDAFFYADGERHHVVALPIAANGGVETLTGHLDIATAFQRIETERTLPDQLIQDAGGTPLKDGLGDYYAKRVLSAAHTLTSAAGVKERPFLQQGQLYFTAPNSTALGAIQSTLAERGVTGISESWSGAETHGATRLPDAPRYHALSVSIAANGGAESFADKVAGQTPANHRTR